MTKCRRLLVCRDVALKLRIVALISVTTFPASEAKHPFKPFVVRMSAFVCCYCLSWQHIGMHCTVQWPVWLVLIGRRQPDLKLCLMAGLWWRGYAGRSLTIVPSCHCISFFSTAHLEQIHDGSHYFCRNTGHVTEEKVGRNLLLL